MTWNFNTETTRISSVKPGELLHIDNWVNGKMLAIALDGGSFNTSNGMMEYKVYANGKIQVVQDWQMRVSNKI